MNEKEVFEYIREWALKRGIYASGDVKTQFVKLQEETGELAKAILKKDEEEFIDAIGDCVVVLTNLARLGNSFFNKPSNSDITIEGCVKSAYEVISERNGKMENGTFVKDNG